MKFLNFRTIYLLAQLNLLALCVTLAGGFVMQFLYGEIPCPLCYMQRLAMMLCGFGLVTVILQGRRGAGQTGLNGTTPDGDLRAVSSGYGFVIVSAWLGACLSARQILLHIVPPDPGFASPILGLHLYTWGLIVFVAEILTSGLILTFAQVQLQAPLQLSQFASTVGIARPSGTQDNSEPALFGGLQKALIGGFGVIVVANMLAVFAAAGWHWGLPDDPVSYLLWR